jgi:hypothetical protein
MPDCGLIRVVVAISHNRQRSRSPRVQMKRNQEEPPGEIRRRNQRDERNRRDRPDTRAPLSL